MGQSSAAQAGDRKSNSAHGPPPDHHRCPGFYQLDVWLLALAVHRWRTKAIDLRDLRAWFALLECQAEQQYLVRAGKRSEAKPGVDWATLERFTKRNPEQDRQSVCRLRRAGLTSQLGHELEFPDPRETPDDAALAFIRSLRGGVVRVPRSVLRYLAERGTTAGPFLALLAAAAKGVEGLKDRGRGRCGWLSVLEYSKLLRVNRKTLAAGFAWWKKAGWMRELHRGALGASVWATDPQWLRERPPALRAVPVENSITERTTYARPTKAADAPVSQNGHPEGVSSITERTTPAKDIRSPSENDSRHITSARRADDRSAPGARRVGEAVAACGGAVGTQHGIEPGNVTRAGILDPTVLDELAQRLAAETGREHKLARQYVWGCSQLVAARKFRDPCAVFATLIRRGNADLTNEHERAAILAIRKHDERLPQHSVIARLLPALATAEPDRVRDPDPVNDRLSSRARILRDFRGQYAAKHEAAELAKLTPAQRSNANLAREAIKRGREIGEQTANGAFSKAFTHDAYRDAARELTGFRTRDESGEVGWGASAAQTAIHEAPRANDDPPATAEALTTPEESDDSRATRDTTRGDKASDDASNAPRRVRRVAAARRALPFKPVSFSTIFPAGVPVFVPAPYVAPSGGSFTPLRAMKHADLCAAFGIPAEASPFMLAAARRASEPWLDAFDDQNASAGL